MCKIFWIDFHLNFKCTLGETLIIINCMLQLLTSISQELMHTQIPFADNLVSSLCFIISYLWEYFTLEFEMFLLSHYSFLYFKSCIFAFFMFIPLIYLRVFLSSNLFLVPTLLNLNITCIIIVLYFATFLRHLIFTVQLINCSKE